MTKLSKVLGMTVGAFLLTAGVASAATITNVEFDGDVTAFVRPNATFDATLRIVVPNSEEGEFLELDFLGDDRAPVCVPVRNDGGRLLEGTHFVDVELKAPGDEAVFDVKATLFGINGPAVSNRCDFSNDTGDNTFNNVVQTDDDAPTTGTGNQNGSGGSTGGGNSGGSNGLTPPAWFCAVFPNISACGGTGGTTPPPAPTDAQCAAFAAANVGTMPNVYNAGNIALQGYLLSQHMIIPALTQGGAAFGFYGNQTTAAVGVWRSMHPTCV